MSSAISIKRRRTVKRPHRLELSTGARANNVSMTQIMFGTFTGQPVSRPSRPFVLVRVGTLTINVWNSGGAAQHTATIREGHALPHAILRPDLARRDSKVNPSKSLTVRGNSFTATAESEMIRTWRVTWTPADTDARRRNPGQRSAAYRNLHPGPAAGARPPPRCHGVPPRAVSLRHRGRKRWGPRQSRFRSAGDLRPPRAVRPRNAYKAAITSRSPQNCRPRGDLATGRSASAAVQTRAPVTKAELAASALAH
jgi:hypothetical protein